MRKRFARDRRARQSARVEQHREARRTTERRPRDDRRLAVRVQPQIWQPIEDQVETDTQLEARQVHAETLMLAGAEGEMVLHRPVDVEDLGVLVSALVVVRRTGEDTD